LDGALARLRYLFDARGRPRELIKQIAGTNARFVTEDIEGQLRRNAGSADFRIRWLNRKLPRLIWLPTMTAGPLRAREVAERIQIAGARADKVHGRKHFAAGGS